jgi:hypothetical protein
MKNNIGVQGRLGAYLNTMVSELNIDNKGEYLRKLFGKYEQECLVPLLKNQIAPRDKMQVLRPNKQVELTDMPLKRCPTCKGHKKITVGYEGDGFGVQHISEIQSTCNRCHGTGKVA